MMNYHHPSDLIDVATFRVDADELIALNHLSTPHRSETLGTSGMRSEDYAPIEAPIHPRAHADCYRD